MTPLNSWFDMSDPEPEKLTRYLCQQLSHIGIAFVNLARTDFLGKQRGDCTPWVRESFTNFVITNHGFQPEEAERVVAKNGADAVSFGVLFISNPDLPLRVARKAPLNKPNLSLVYGNADESAAGYTDYPSLELSDDDVESITLQ